MIRRSIFGRDELTLAYQSSMGYSKARMAGLRTTSTWIGLGPLSL